MCLFMRLNFKVCWVYLFFSSKALCALWLFFENWSLYVLNWPSAYKKISVTIGDSEKWNTFLCFAARRVSIRQKCCEKFRNFFLCSQPILQYFRPLKKDFSWSEGCKKCVTLGIKWKFQKNKNIELIYVFLSVFVLDQLCIWSGLKQRHG